MGILLTFMFLWNMLGALVLIPALSHFLLNPKTTATSPEAARGEKVAGSVEQGKRVNTQAVTAH
ncbi:hypothetical protein D3C85_1930010 [compost metagenome]|jgi:hypothetical protein